MAALPRSARLDKLTTPKCTRLNAIFLAGARQKATGEAVNRAWCAAKLALDGRCCRSLRTGENNLQTTKRIEGGRVCFALPNVRAKLPAEAGFVSPVRDDIATGADRAYKACRSGSA